MQRGIRTRLFVGLLVVVNWVLVPLLAYGYERWVQPLPYTWLLTGSTLSWGLSVLLVRWAKESLSLSIPNRVTAIALPTVAGALVLALAYGWWHGLDPWRAVALAQLAWVTMALVTVPVFGRSMLVVAASQLLGLMLTSVRPDVVWLQIALLDLVFGVTVVYPQRAQALSLFWAWVTGGLERPPMD